MPKFREANDGSTAAVAELRSPNTGDWDLRFPADWTRERLGDFCWRVLFPRELKRGCISSAFTEKDNFETLEAFPPKWKGIPDGLFSYFYSLCTVVKVRRKEKRKMLDFGDFFFATFARYADRVDLSGQRIHRTVPPKKHRSVGSQFVPFCLFLAPQFGLSTFEELTAFPPIY